MPGTGIYEERKLVIEIDDNAIDSVIEGAPAQG
jgi:hypothetical protein